MNDNLDDRTVIAININCNKYDTFTFVLVIDGHYFVALVKFIALANCRTNSVQFLIKCRGTKGKQQYNRGGEKAL